MSKKTPPFLNSFFILTTIVVLVALSFYEYMKLVGKQKKEEDGLSKEKLLKKTELLSRGIHPDKVIIKSLGNITAQWQDKGVVYNLEEIYLTPDIADLGSSRNNISMKDKKFLVVKLTVRDIRTSGEKRLVPAGNYLRIRKEKRDSAPVVSDYLYLSPQEDGTIYVTFAIERNMSKFNLLIGILSRPRVIELDFDSSDVKTKEGIFILKSGYFPEYSPDLHP